MRTIATLVGLSPATVSMALHNHPRIPEATRRRVRAAARRIGYKPNAKVAELMGTIRSSNPLAVQSCFGVISLYEEEKPWLKSLHLGRMFEGMRRRANALGYRLEPFWLRGPNVTPRRLREILEARGIEGLLCFGGPKIDEPFPAELQQYTVVTQGWSIQAPLHRVINHGYNNTWRALEKAYELGYRRPGIITSPSLNVRASHANIGAYFAWCEHMFGIPALVPVLRLGRPEPHPILEWLKHHRPDVIVIAVDYDALADYWEFFRLQGIKIPQDIGVVAISQILRGTSFSGLEENSVLMGQCAVEMLMARLMTEGIGKSNSPRIEMVESTWVEGRSLQIP